MLLGFPQLFESVQVSNKMVGVFALFYERLLQTFIILCNVFVLKCFSSFGRSLKFQKMNFFDIIVEIK